MGPSSSGARMLDTKMDVGPSAAPMIPMDAAWGRVNPNNTAMITVKNIPN